MHNNIETVSGHVEKHDKSSTDLEQALAVAGKQLE